MFCADDVGGVVGGKWLWSLWSFGGLWVVDEVKAVGGGWWEVCGVWPSGTAPQ